MLLKIFMFIMTAIIGFTAMSCSQETPVTQQLNDTADQTEGMSLYMLGNEEPIEAEHTANFLFHGPGPFFLWVLELSDEQKTALREIGETYREQMRNHHRQARHSRDHEQLRSEHQALRQAMHEEILTILTDEQKAILAEIETQMEQGIYPEIVIEKRVEHLTDILDLNTDQQNALAALLADYGAQLIGIRNTYQDPREGHRAARSILQEFHHTFTDLLNEDQLVLLAEYRQQIETKHPRHRFAPGHPRGN
jgi:hypothetical protein